MKRALTILFLLFLATTAHGQSISQLFAFACNPYPTCPDGTKPASIIQASDGNLYGTTTGPGGGGIFEITEAGKLTVLYTFTTNPQTGFYDQGYFPASLAEGTDGFLYGVNSAGGPNSASSGTIFKISKTGTGFQVLQAFCTSCTTGANPNSLVAGSDGNMYGITGYGGSFNSRSPYCQSGGCGVIVRLTPPGTYTVLYALNGTTDSSLPLGVIQASDGNLDGVAGFFRPGTVFKFQLSNSAFTTALQFPERDFPAEPSDASFEWAAVRLNAADECCEWKLCGDDFLIGSDRECAKSSATHAAGKKQFAVGPFLQATDGNLWNTSYVGGTSGLGIAFAVTPSGAIVDTLPFSPAVGGSPVGGVIQALDGTLFGTASVDGTVKGKASANGTVYMITGLPPKH